MTKNNSYNVLVDMGQDNAYSQPATIESDGLEFQDNSPSHTSPPPPPPPPPPSTSAQHNMSNSNFYNDASPRAKRPLWSLDFYSQFFDVDTTQVLERCLKSMYPRGDFAQDTLNHQPDLYGPFWIPTSVVFTVFVCSSLAGSLAAYIADREFFYDFNLLGFSVGVVYLYAFLCPVVFWACTKWFKCDPNLLEIINYYGYGLTIWIPVSMAPTFTSNRQKKIWEKQRKDLEEKKKNAKTYVNQTPFRYMERNFKSIVPPPDFSQVVDFSKGINFAEQGVTAVSLSQDLKQLSPLFGDPANDNEPCTNDDPSAAQAYIIKSVPGLIIIPQAFTPKAQRHLIKECLRNYPRAPNTSNLHTHYHVPEEGIWPLFEKQVKGTLKPSDPQFYVAKKAVVDSEDDHHDDDTSSDDEHEHDKTNNNNNNNTCAMNAPTACSDDFKPIIDGPKPDPLPAPGVPLLPPSVLVRKIRWITLGYQYHWPTKTYHLDRRYPFPPEIAEITKAVVTACENVGGKKEDGTDEWRNTYKGSDFEAEAGVVNYYQFRDTLMGHVDRSELNMDAPLVSIR
ncbi:hypothetical protein BDF20DRAFT_829763 [Mycotypha africana]|uniref:uncharacterized protein n=1 Tax=Mycotypha africana TaxID=64632 RepID=UPI0023017747|nr:uncharacterized protein BDF20DRAFT_829763 [Mycotypha africana]KAI8967297.1 hypothetical protein BDF20DRAFT_829763 [Mycotypha africana]